MTLFSFLWKMLIAPRSTSRALVEESRVRYAAALVLSYGIFNSLGFLISALRHEYPPPPEVLQVWIRTWGEYAMLPFLKIPPEQYRMFQAIILIPLSLAIWMLMAGTARLLALLFNGKVHYEGYLNLTGFGFFTFLWIAAILDTIYSGYLRQFAVPALNMEYGTAIRAFFVWFPPLEYVILYGLGVLLLTPFQISTGKFLDRVQGAQEGKGFYFSLFLYGVGYGAASQACTAPVFIGAILAGFQSGSLLTGVGVLLLACTVAFLMMVGVSLLVAGSKKSIIGKLKASTEIIKKVSAIVLIIAAIYILVEYWIAFGT
jgi:cytochrome c biogenesis protein CcdA